MSEQLWILVFSLFFILIIGVISLLSGYLHYRRRELEHRQSQQIVKDVLSRLVNSLSFWNKIRTIEQTAGTVFIVKGSDVIYACPTKGCDCWCSAGSFCSKCGHRPVFSDKDRLIMQMPKQTAELAAIKEALQKIDVPSLDLGFE